MATHGVAQLDAPRAMNETDASPIEPETSTATNINTATSISRECSENLDNKRFRPSNSPECSPNLDHKRFRRHDVNTATTQKIAASPPYLTPVVASPTSVNATPGNNRPTLPSEHEVVSLANEQRADAAPPINEQRDDAAPPINEQLADAAPPINEQRDDAAPPHPDPPARPPPLAVPVPGAERLQPCCFPCGLLACVCLVVAGAQAAHVFVHGPAAPATIAHRLARELDDLNAAINSRLSVDIRPPSMAKARPTDSKAFDYAPVELELTVRHHVARQGGPVGCTEIPLPKSFLSTFWHPLMPMTKVTRMFTPALALSVRRLWRGQSWADPISRFVGPSEFFVGEEVEVLSPEAEDPASLERWWAPLEHDLWQPAVVHKKHPNGVLANFSYTLDLGPGPDQTLVRADPFHIRRRRNFLLLCNRTGETELLRIPSHEWAKRLRAEAVLTPSFLVNFQGFSSHFEQYWRLVELPFEERTQAARELGFDSNIFGFSQASMGVWRMAKGGGGLRGIGWDYGFVDDKKKGDSGRGKMDSGLTDAAQPLAPYYLKSHAPLWMGLLMLCEHDFLWANPWTDRRRGEIEFQQFDQFHCRGPEVKRTLNRTSESLRQWRRWDHHELAFFFVSLAVHFVYLLIDYLPAHVFVFTPLIFIVVNLLRHVDTPLTSVRRSLLTALPHTAVIIAVDYSAPWLPPTLDTWLQRLQGSGWVWLLCRVLPPSALLMWRRWNEVAEAGYTRLQAAKRARAQTTAQNANAGVGAEGDDADRGAEAGAHPEGGAPIGTCRICLMGADDMDTTTDSEDWRLIAPCLCKGSMQLVHVQCLTVWRTSSANPESFYKCENCGYRYNLRRTMLAQVLRLSLVLHVCALATLAALTVVTGALVQALNHAFWGADITEFLFVDEILSFVVESPQQWMQKTFLGGAVDMVTVFTGLSLIGFAACLMVVGSMPLLWANRGGVRGAMVLIFLVFGIFKAFAMIYDRIARASGRWLARAESMVLDIRNDA